MNSWMAAASSSSLTTYIPLAVPFGVLLAPVVAGTMTRLTDRKLPYERLDLLVKCYNDWPREMEGKEAISRQITWQVDEIERVTDAEQKWRKRSRPMLGVFYLGIVWLTIRLTDELYRSTFIQLIASAVGLAVGVVLATYFGDVLLRGLTAVLTPPVNATRWLSLWFRSRRR